MLKYFLQGFSNSNVHNEINDNFNLQFVGPRNSHKSVVSSWGTLLFHALSHKSAYCRYLAG